MALPVVVVSSGGLPVSESTSGYGLPVEVSVSFGLPVTIVDAGGLPVVGVGAVIILSASTIPEDASVGDLVGTLSVSGGSGSYTFTLTDDAGGLFALDGSDDTLLEVADALDYETATSHLITVEADNGVDDPISRVITISVTDVNEASPVITSDGGGASASINAAENQTAVTTVTATDADGTAVITYSISGGADAAKFQIGSSSGVLTFVTAPDYETPTDADTDNDYVVVVQASDGTNTDTQTITVTVTNVDEGGGGGSAGEPIGLLLALTKAA